MGALFAFPARLRRLFSSPGKAARESNRGNNRQGTGKKRQEAKRTGNPKTRFISDAWNCTKVQKLCKARWNVRPIPWAEPQPNRYNLNLNGSREDEIRHRSMYIHLITLFPYFFINSFYFSHYIYIYIYVYFLLIHPYHPYLNLSERSGKGCWKRWGKLNFWCQ